MTREEAVKRANEVRESIERDVDDLAAHFEGGIYGSEPFSPEARAALAGLRKTLANG